MSHGSNGAMFQLNHAGHCRGEGKTDLRVFTIWIQSCGFAKINTGVI